MILLAPIKTEKAIAQVEFSNTLTFKVQKNATKEQIKKEVESLFGVKVVSVRTQITQKGYKQALVTLSKESSAEDVTTKLKMA
ncbi:MAG TPA: 50S ribosomal protein L23 [Candidatus Bilamarchaeaceae archaeon]|nr:50S ribosomal protein L23 [Candidatus Bilamarchaeaceae archaeon]